MISPLIYHDGENLYLEFPTYVLNFPFTEGGLAKALKHCPKIPMRSRPAPLGTTNLPKALKPKIKIAKETKRKREVNNFSEEVKASARELIRKRLGSLS